MREGSCYEITKGMRVVGRDGGTIGGVHDVIMDEGSGIFVGLAVRPSLFAHSLNVPGDRVDRLHEGVVYVDAVQDELQPYTTPEERRHEAVQAYDERQA